MEKGGGGVSSKVSDAIAKKKEASRLAGEKREAERLEAQQLAEAQAETYRAAQAAAVVAQLVPPSPSASLHPLPFRSSPRGFSARHDWTWHTIFNTHQIIKRCHHLDFPPTAVGCSAR